MAAAKKPKPPKPPGPKDVKNAALEARQGHTDVALAKLRGYADAGLASAGAAAAEILAFRGEWEDAARYATMLLAEPSAVYTSNVFVTSAAIVRRAAEVLDQPTLVDAAAKRVPAKYAAMRDATLLDDASRRREADRKPRRAELTAALALAPTLKRFRGKPKTHLDRHCFSLAVVFDVDDAIAERWDAANDFLHFDQAMEAARAFVRLGDPAAAWAAIDSRPFWPVENTQVAPVELVTDVLLAPLMTPERCAAILAKPAGA